MITVPPGTRFGPYEIVGPVGAGGMGEVYKARDTRLHRDVAIKVLPAAVTGEAAARERFLREARAVASLQHPNICTLYDVGETADGQVYLVMELLQGVTAEQRAGKRPLEVAELMDAGIALADELETAHAAGIVHRDIKPANIVLNGRGGRLIGIAQMRPAEPASSAHTALPDPQLTSPGMAVGTVVYMSPEQLQGEALDARSDLFSLGLVLFELATGRPAFTGGTSSAIAAAILHHAPAAPSTLRPGLPPRIDDVILKALEKDRGLRYQSAAEIRADLQRLKRDSDAVAVTVPPTSRPAASRPRRWTALAAAAFLVRRGDRGLGRLRASPGATTDRYGDARPRRLREHDRRPGVRRHAATGPGGAVATIAVPQPGLGSAHPPDAPVDGPCRRRAPEREAAHEVCERIGGGAMLEGSIASLGHAVRARTARRALRQRRRPGRGTGAGGEQGGGTRRLEPRRQHLQSPGRRIADHRRQHNRPLEEASTPSLDALKAFSAGATSFEGQDPPCRSTGVPSRSTRVSPSPMPGWASPSASSESRSWPPGAPAKPSACAIAPPTASGS